MRVCFVCYANFCRSPVAEFLLKSKIENIEVTSAGISAFSTFNMDNRSNTFLKKKLNRSFLHTPRTADNNLLSSCDLILAMDVDILKMLIENFPKHKEKYKLISVIDNYSSVVDPYQFEDIEDYNSCMERIDELCEKWSIELEAEN